MDKLIEEDIDYLNFFLLDAVNQKPIDSEFYEEPISVVLNNYLNNSGVAIMGYLRVLIQGL